MLPGIFDKGRCNLPTIIDKMEDYLNRPDNLPSFNACFQNWLDSQSDDDLRHALREDIGEMIRDKVREEIERRGTTATRLITA